MRTALIVLAIALLPLAAPLAAADEPIGFGHCEIVWYAYGEYDDPLTGERKSIEAPGGFECVW